MDELRFATVGTSAICERFLEALATLPDARHVAACSRSPERARALAERSGARLALSGIPELARCDEVDAVYLATPNGLHASQALELVEAGKHVLVEKPLAANEREAREVFSAAHRRGVVVLEGLRSLHVPAFAAIERVVAEELGPIRLATLRFSKVTSRMARLRAGKRLNVFDPELAGGALMDIGVYCVEPAVALFGEPEEVRALAVTVPAPGSGVPVDLAGEALLGYADKVVSLSFGKASDGLVPCEVQGERATLLWDHVSCPAHLRVCAHEGTGGLAFQPETGAPVEVPVEEPADDMACEVRDFVDAVRGVPAAVALRERLEGVTLSSLRVMDEIRRQVGVRFPADGERA